MANRRRRKRRKTRTENPNYTQSCTCSSSRRNCSDSDCCNRALFIECTESSCGLRSVRCRNRQIQVAKYPLVEVFDTNSSRGRGLKLSSHGSAVPQNTKVIEYTGASVVDPREEGGVYLSKYLLRTSGGALIDTSDEATSSAARFINHSCDPNTHIEEWTVRGVPTIVFTACRNIAAGEEITADYGDHFGVHFDCQCGSPDCRGNVGVGCPVVAAPPAVMPDERSWCRNRGAAASTVRREGMVRSGLASGAGGADDWLQARAWESAGEPIRGGGSGGGRPQGNGRKVRCRKVRCRVCVCVCVCVCVSLRC